VELSRRILSRWPILNSVEAALEVEKALAAESHEVVQEEPVFAAEVSDVLSYVRERLVELDEETIVMLLWLAGVDTRQIAWMGAPREIVHATVQYLLKQGQLDRFVRELDRYDRKLLVQRGGRQKVEDAINRLDALGAKAKARG
jgi:hypothetical protein